MKKNQLQFNSLLFLFICFLFLSISASKLYAQQFDAELMSLATIINIDNNELNRTDKYLIKINTRDGEKYTKVKIYHSNLNILKTLKAEIRDESGNTIRKLKSREIVEKSQFSDILFYSDYMVSEFTLKHNTYPYYIAYSYETTAQEYFYIANWLPVLNTDIPTLESSLSLTTDLDYLINYRTNKIDTIRIDTTEGEMNYYWKTKYSEPVKNEIFSPDMNSLLPNVKIVPKNFHFEIQGSLSSWDSYGCWQYNLNSGLLELPVNEISVINNIVTGCNNNREKIKNIYNYVQNNTRYLNISIETGGLKPYSAMYVAQNKYGDCKALSNYFMALLNHVGIDSYYAKVNTSEPKVAIDKSFPSQQFNHAIVYIPTEDDTFWIDCTSDYPFDYVSSFIHGRESLIIRKEGGFFKKIPELDVKDLQKTSKFLFKYNSEKFTDIDIEIVFRGNIYEYLKHVDKNYKTEQRDYYIRQNILPTGFEVQSFAFHETDIDSAKIEMEIKARKNGIYKDFGDEIIAGVYPANIPNFESPGFRKLPLQIDFPISFVDTLEYAIPQSSILQIYPEDMEYSTQYGSYSIQTLVKNDLIRIVRKLVIHSGEYSLTEYSDFYSYIATILEKDHFMFLKFEK